MADIARGFILGFIAGVVVCIVWLISGFIFNLITFSLLIGGIILLGMGYGAVGGVIGGIYARLFERLPGKTAVVKGITIGVSFLLMITIFKLIYVVIYVIAGFIVQPIALSKEGILYLLVAFISLFTEKIIIAGCLPDILFCILYGFVLGKLWESNFQRISNDSNEEVIEFG